MQPAARRTDAAIRARLELYYDAVPRAGTHVEDFGSLCLFVGNSPGQTWYGRPSAEHAGPIPAAAVAAVLERQHALGVPQSLEWVEETTPSLTPVARAAGLVLHRHPLMIFEGAESSGPHDAGTARVLGPDDPALAAAIAAAHLAFAEPGTAIGYAGPAELAAKARELSSDGWLPALAARMRAGTAVVAAAFDDGHAVGSGQHNPVAATTEIVGVGTLARYRRRGFAHAVTTVLVEQARANGIETIFLSAGSEDVARIYARIGFRRVGTAIVAEAPRT